MNGPSHDEGTDHDVTSHCQSEFLRYLNLGLHVAPTADQDNHKKNWGNATSTRTGLIASSLTKPAVLSALRDRHVYATTDKNLRVIPMIGGHLIGTQVTGTNVPAAGSTITIALELKDDDEPTAEYQVLVYADQQGGNAEADVIESADFVGDGSFTISGVLYQSGNRYYFLKIIQTDKDGLASTTGS